MNPENIILEDDEQITLIDFGISLNYDMELRNLKQKRINHYLDLKNQKDNQIDCDKEIEKLNK